MRPRICLLLFLPLAALAQDPATDAKAAPAASLKLATSARPLSLGRLGPMADHVVAYFSMDDVTTGGLFWSRAPLSVRASATVKARDENGRAFLDFSAPHSRVDITPPIKLLAHFSLAAWVQTPGPTKNAAIWQGSGGDYLTVKDMKITCWSAITKKDYVYAESTEPLQGWHHVALVGEGRKTQAFLDGQPLAVVEDLDVGDLCTVGNHKLTRIDNRYMAAGIDSQFIFDRPLTPEEVVTVMNFSKPLK